MKTVAFFLIALSAALIWIESHNRTRMPSDQVVITAEEKPPPPDMMRVYNGIGIEGDSASSSTTIYNNTLHVCQTGECRGP